MSGVHIIALVSAVATLSVIVEMTRRRQLREKYALVWLAVAVVVAVIAITPGTFNHLAHAMGVVSPPALLTVLAALFLLVVCVHLSWELGRLEDKTRLLAEEVALLRSDLDGLRSPGGQRDPLAPSPEDPARGAHVGAGPGVARSRAGDPDGGADPSEP